MEEANKPGNQCIRIGCQGWNYNDWKTRAGGETVFYPPRTRPDAMLSLYARIFQTVEVDSTFYAIPSFSTVENWHRRTPDYFKFCLKMPQEITHVHRLDSDSFPVLDAFCERVLDLKEKLGAVLIQMPPSFDGSRKNAINLRQFLRRIPRNIRFAIEFRNPDWMITWTFEELKRTKVALCLVEGNWIDRAQMFGCISDADQDIAYIRFMGERDLTDFSSVQRDSSDVLDEWSKQLARINAREIYVTFSNFFEGFAPASAAGLMKRLGQPTVNPSELENQSSLF